MRAYLDTIEKTEVASPPPPADAPIWIAAHGPGLLRLAAARTDGANTYLMPPAHTKQARETLGADKRLNVVVPCCPTEDAERARHLGRRMLSIYLPLPAYQRQWQSWGFDESDYEGGGSDRLIDGCVAWGSVSTIRARMEEHRAAGASHVIVSALNPDGGGPAWKLYEELAP
jgi:probable F420-dependent oxidoreductase